MNYKGFHKISEDKHTVVMRHPEGHEIKVAKAALSPEMRKQLSKLPVHKSGGGDKETAMPPEDDISQEAEQSSQQLSPQAPVSININQAPQQPPVPLRPSSDYKVTPSDPVQYQPLQDIANVPQLMKQAEADAKNYNPQKAQEEEFNRRVDEKMHWGEVNSRSGFAPDRARIEASVLQQMANEKESTMQQAKSQAQQQQADFIHTNQLRQQAGLAPLPPPPGMAQDSQLAQSRDVALPQQSGGGLNYNPYQGMGQVDLSKINPIGGLDKQMAGIQAEANAQGDLAKQQAGLYATHAQTLEDIATDTRAKYSEHLDEVNRVIQDMKDFKIDPDRYVNNIKSEPGRYVRTMIGLVLGGMGGGLTKQGNTFAAYLQNQIQNDVNAQKAEMGNKQNIFSAMQHRFQNTMDAQKMTTAIYAARMEDEIKAAAGKMGTPIAQARAMQLIGPIEQTKNQALMQVGMRQAAMRNLQNGGNAAAALSYMVNDPAKVGEVAKAYGEILNLNKLQENMVDSFMHIRNKGLLGQLTSPADVESAEQAFTGVAQTALEHRFNAEDAAAKAKALFPGKLDSEATISNKLQRIQALFDGSRQQHGAVVQAYTNGMVPIPMPRPIFEKRKK